MSTQTAPVQTITFHIVGGPGTDRIIDMFKYAFDKTTPMRAMFEGHFGRLRGKLTTKLEMQITMLEYESGARGTFILSGNIHGYRVVRGFYNAERHEGTFELVPFDSLPRD
ncbi:MAG: hypothetical protein WAU02_02150 [Candidatus Saccharimonadales bacterium]